MPIFTAVLGLYFLKEHLLGHEIGLMIASFLGVVILITGKTHILSIEGLDKYPPEDESQRPPHPLSAFAMLLAVPILKASQNIAFRHMRGINLHAATIYLGLTCTLCYGLWIWAFDMGFNVFWNLSKFEWLLMALSGGMSLLNLMLR
jgi:drug/metabolite transporter (DMT)-like permease